MAIARQQIEQKTRVVITKANRAAARRITVKSYYVVPFSPIRTSITKFAPAWEHKIVHRHNGSSRELFTAYLPNGKKTIQERRQNGEVTWLWLQNYKEVNLIVQPTRELSGTYVDKRYLRWGGKNYMLPTRLPTP
ncbi:hypothetical protein [Hymenobacter sp. YC55]|uniref:hypothetical protein n=1 Tax=Hymenobacter sp. YC55 TaxID=3034019 RepID=UPI0023F6B033|nr:hypothetical protein [Hymenobacter sp. YC55]MDF7812411.1 hypothetical protein [Hymenobacter sp. YC55]